MKNKNKKTIVLLIISVFFVVFFQTIAYSSFSSTINITGESVARVETDVRITDFSVYEVEGNVVSSYEKFSKDTLTSNVSFPADSSSIIYKIEITNYGSNSIGILDIKCLSSELEYELIDYNLTDKLCGDNGNCSNYAVKTFYIKISGAKGIYDINLLFEFQPYVTISYTDIVNNSYPTEILKGSNLSINIGIDNAVGVLVFEDGVNSNDYTYVDGVLNINDVKGNLEISGFSLTKHFEYTGGEQTYQIDYPGMYRLEVWGASGGSVGSSYSGGVGGYSRVDATLPIDAKLFLNVGGSGMSGCLKETCFGGYNGGGASSPPLTELGSSVVVYGAGGGGATHIALETGLLSSLSSKKEKILVVAGGGGGTSYQVYSGVTYSGVGGVGGGISGGNGTNTQSGWYAGNGGSQTSGGIPGSSERGESGSFGQGGNGIYAAGGGGGGFYGGGASNQSGAGGGSGYVSSLYEGVTIAGNASVPTYDGTSTMIGNYGNGYAKITLIEMIKE